MKAIILVLSPKECMNLLNGYLSILVRKKFPSNYVGWVYIYVTKEKKTKKWAKRNILCSDVHNGKPSGHYQLWLKDIDDGLHTILNGKVIGRFWCGKVEEIKLDYKYDHIYNVVEKQWFYTQSLEDYELYKKSCLTSHEIYKYLNCYGGNKCSGYAIHITKVEPFDEPKEISELMKTIDNFDGLDCWRCSKHHNCSFNRDKKCEKLKLTCAPRKGWCYVEV